MRPFLPMNLSMKLIKLPPMEVNMCSVTGPHIITVNQLQHICCLCLGFSCVLTLDMDIKNREILNAQFNEPLSLGFRNVPQMSMSNLQNNDAWLW